MVRLYNILLSSCLILFGENLIAQINYALSASMSTNVLGNSAYPLSNLNDRTIVACNSWTSNGTWLQVTNNTSGEYIEWKWTSPRSLSKMNIHFGETGNRFMNAASIEYFNGSTWTVLTSFSGLNPNVCAQTINFNAVYTTGLRLTSMTITGSQSSNPCFREIELFGPTVNNDASVSSIIKPNLCDYNQAIVAKISNLGKKTLDSFRLYWSVNSVLQSVFYIQSKLAFGKDTAITLNANFLFSKNSNYTIKAWTLKPNGTLDSLQSNDTFIRSIAFVGTPAAPKTTNAIQCGVGRAKLTAIPASISDSVAWYDDSIAGNFIGLGKTINSPLIYKTTTFYAQAGGGKRLNIDNGFAGTTLISASTTVYNGAYFNVQPNKTIYLDSLTIRIYQNIPSGFRLYFRSGTYVGYENNPNAWTLLSSENSRVFSANGKYYARIYAANTKMLANQSYGFYLSSDPTLNGNDFYVSSGGFPVNNSDVSFGGSAVVNTLFASGGLFSPWMIDIELIYGFGPLTPCNILGKRVPLTITLRPRPIGAELLKGSPFEGQFRSGDVTVPDIIELNKTVVYEIASPSGKLDSDYGTTWTINSVNVSDELGKQLPNTDYSFSYPSSNGPGRIEFTPIANYLDRFITFTVNYSDLGPNFCDSSIKRTIVVAPTPKTNFKFPDIICLGDAVLFENTTTIYSGFAHNLWHFGDGDSSDIPSPVHVYTKPGTYQVKLQSKSYPWNILHDTTMTIIVGELPLVKFTVNNKCEGIPLSFQNLSTSNIGTIDYDWDFGDKSPHSNISDPIHNYTSPGAYQVIMKASANGCAVSLIKNAYSFARPKANFSTPSASICSGTELSLPNTSTLAYGGQGAFWSFGDNKNSTLYHGSHVYSAANVYTVKLLAVSEFDCKDSISKTVTIKVSPAPDFESNQLCSKSKSSFSNLTFEDLPNPIYEWSFSDGYTFTGKSVLRDWPIEGPYSAILKATYSNGCSAEISKDFTVLIQAKADFVVNDVCSGEAASFVNLSKGELGNIQYFWDFGNGNTSTIPAPEVLFQSNLTTTYTVSLIASYPFGCNDTIQKTITVFQTPICDFTISNLGNMKHKFIPANQSYYKYEWFFGEGGTSKLTKPDYQYLFTGNFKITLRTTNIAGCICESSKYIFTSYGLQQESMKTFQIYPNPTSGKFSIINKESGIMSIEIFDVLGKKIHSENTIEKEVLIDLTNHAYGIYTLRITIDGITYSGNIVLIP